MKCRAIVYSLIGGVKGIPIAFITDPDGYWIEILQGETVNKFTRDTRTIMAEVNKPTGPSSDYKRVTALNLTRLAKIILCSIPCTE